MTNKENEALARIDPQALISAAIQKSAPIETLERLVALAKEVKTWTAKEAYHQAISDFQRDCPTIKKTATASIPTQAGTLEFSYAPLDEICAAITPVLSKYGLSYSWRQAKATQPNAVAVTCRISHSLGHSEESEATEIPYRSGGNLNPGMAVGSALSYAKRYALCGMLGIAPQGEDDDAGPRTTGGPESEYVSGLVADLQEGWRDQKLSRYQARVHLRQNHIDERLVNPEMSWVGVDPAAIQMMLDQLKDAAYLDALRKEKDPKA